MVKKNIVLLQKIRKFNQKLNRMQYIAPDDFFKDYKYLSSREFQKQKGGVCWDYVLYEKEYFQKHFPTVQTEAYFFCGIDTDNDMPSHTVLLFFLDDKTYWFESSWKSKSGIYEFNSKIEALQTIQKLHKDFCINEQKETLVDYNIIKYEPLDEKLKGIGCGGFYEYMNKQKEVDLKSLESFINYCNDMIIANESYYRITYDNIGIYEALKQNISLYEWDKLLNSERFQWLPKPPGSVYNGINKSYFTETGFEWFNKYTLPVIKPYINTKKIKIEKINKLRNIIYQDQFQVVC